MALGGGARYNRPSRYKGHQLALESLPGDAESIMGTPTLSDIAKRVGVSAAAVSLALNKGETNRVSAKTRQRILQVAEEMNYSPNELAKALAENRTHMVGLVVPMRDPIFFNLFIAQTLAGIQSTLMRRGYNLLVYSPATKSGAIARDKVYESKYTDGIIFVNTRSCSTSTVMQTIRELQSTKVKFSMVNSYYGRAPINYVGVDDAAIATAAADYLVDKGHRKIAFLSGAHSLPGHMQLVKGLERGLRKHGLALPADSIGCTEYDRDQAFAILDRWFMYKGRRPTAILVADDQLLMYLYDYADLRKLAIPGDVSVLARRNIGVEDHIRPRPASIVIPTFQMGQLAAELLIDTIENPNCGPRRVMLPFELLEGTTA
jgi:LacI family transcriptional regulator